MILHMKFSAKIDFPLNRGKLYTNSSLLFKEQPTNLQETNLSETYAAKFQIKFRPTHNVETTSSP